MYQANNLKAEFILSRVLGDNFGLFKSCKEFETPAGVHGIHQYYVENSNRPLSGHGAKSVNTESMWSAIGEAIERYSLYQPHSFTGLISYNELAEKDRIALGPEKLTYYTDQQISKLENVIKFTPETKAHWFLAKNLHTNEDTLIPTDFIFFNSSEGQSLFQNNSSSAAAHFDSEKAISLAILECIERDAFLFVWNTMALMPKIDLVNLQNSKIKNLIKKIGPVAEQLEVILVTTNIEIPTAICVFKGVNAQVSRMISGACALDPFVAIEKSILEMMVCLNSVEVLKDLEFGHKDVSMFKTIDSFHQRVAFYKNPETNEIIDQILKSKEYATEEKLMGIKEKFSEFNYKSLLAYMESLDFEIYAANVTPRDVKSLGFSVYKVLIPKLLPLNHDYLARPLNSERLYTLGKEIGLFDKILTENDLNIYPHPFP